MGPAELEFGRLSQCPCQLTFIESLRWWPHSLPRRTTGPPQACVEPRNRSYPIAVVFDINVLSAWRSASAPENSMSQATSATKFARSIIQAFSKVSKSGLKTARPSKPRPSCSPGRLRRWLAQTGTAKSLACHSFCREVTNTRGPSDSSSLHPRFA